MRGLAGLLRLQRPLGRTPPTGKGESPIWSVMAWGAADATIPPPNPNMAWQQERLGMVV